MLQVIDRTAEKFMVLLDEAERTGKLDALADLFSEGSELMTQSQEAPYQGRNGARKFWEAYLSAFRRVHTNFLHAIEGRGGIALEWTAEGVLPAGEPIELRGVTVLELEGGLIKSLRSYHDTDAFVRPALSAPKA